MNNILFFLTPKALCDFVYDDFTVRQAVEKMESSGYAALPILNRHGQYRGTITEGDLLWALKNLCYMDIRQAEARRIMEISRRKADSHRDLYAPNRIFFLDTALKSRGRRQPCHGFLSCLQKKSLALQF